MFWCVTDKIMLASHRLNSLPCPMFISAASPLIFSNPNILLFFTVS